MVVNNYDDACLLMRLCIHESQVVRQLFFQQSGHVKYSENLIEYEITKLKNDEDILKVLVESNH